MKKRGEHLASHTQQMLDYWVQLAGRRPAYCVLCNFDEFWIYDFNKDILSPVDRVNITDLPDRFGPLAFLFPTGETPLFGDDHETVTREAADHLAFVFNSLTKRGIKRDLAQRFVLQMLVALFAKDIDLLDRYFVERLLNDAATPADTYDLLGGLFTAMNTKGGVTGGRYRGVSYFNGGLFAEPAAVELNAEELRRLREAASKNWSKVRPEIFGTIFEHSMGSDEKGKRERHAFGAHFTSQLDILKIVKPTITDPWERLIERTANGPEPIRNLNRLHGRLQRYRVLDPACGSGNFLYLAYRELKRIEIKLLDTITSLSKTKQATKREQMALSFVTARQFFGIDINPFAVELAKVTLMIARKLAIDELQINEPALPLDNLDANFRTVDALIQVDDDGNATRPDWFPADAIIGNPPFLGAKRLKPERGTDYVNAVRKLYPEVPGMADYCVYWIRRAHDHLPECTPNDPITGRAGLVGTQNIRNNKSREGGLDHVVGSGVIVEAVDNQPWSGEAEVNVSIVNWVATDQTRDAGDELLVPAERRLWSELKQTQNKSRARRKKGTPKTRPYVLKFRPAGFINSALSDETDVSCKQSIMANKSPKTCFQGKIPGYPGFMLNRQERDRLVSDSGEVIYPYLIGRELLDGDPVDRWAIDFRDLNMLDAQGYPSAFAHVRDRVLPDVRAKLEDALENSPDNVKPRKEHLDRWWQFWNRRDQLNSIFDRQDRVIACSRTTRRPIVAFISTDFCPGDLVQIFAFDDDYSFGVLQASAHFEWFRKSSRLKVESDTRYSSRSVYETLPWPQAPSTHDVLDVAEAGRAVRAVRDQHLPRISGGLRALYRSLELPGKSPLRDAHLALDAAVLKAFGFSPKKDLLAQLLDLNLSVAAREKVGESVTAPGIPNSYLDAGGDPAVLITDDCVRAG